MNKSIDNDDLNKIKEYLNACEYALKATVWTEQGSNEGYYGISLKVDEYKHKTTSSTGKKVEKIELKSEQVLSSWDTIAKAAEDENISASKMSRSIKNKTIFDFIKDIDENFFILNYGRNDDCEKIYLVSDKNKDIQNLIYLLNCVSGFIENLPLDKTAKKS